MTNDRSTSDALRGPVESDPRQVTQVMGAVPRVSEVVLEDVLAMGADELEALVPALEVRAEEMGTVADEAVAAAADAIAIAAAAKARLGGLQEGKER